MVCGFALFRGAAGGYRRSCRSGCRAIVNEKSRWPPIPGTAFDNLLGGPFRRRVARHASVQDFSIGVPDHEEDIERLEQNRLNAEKIAGPYVRCVMLQELSPAWRGSPRG